MAFQLSLTEFIIDHDHLIPAQHHTVWSLRQALFRQDLYLVQDAIALAVPLLYLGHLKQVGDLLRHLVGLRLGDHALHLVALYGVRYIVDRTDAAQDLMHHGAMLSLGVVKTEMLAMGKTLLNFGKITPLKEVCRQVEQVSCSQITEVAREVFAPERLSVIQYG